MNNIENINFDEQKPFDILDVESTSSQLRLMAVRSISAIVN